MGFDLAQYQFVSGSVRFDCPGCGNGLVAGEACRVPSSGAAYCEVCDREVPMQEFVVKPLMPGAVGRLIGRFEWLRTRGVPSRREAILVLAGAAAVFAAGLLAIGGRALAELLLW